MSPDPSWWKPSLPSDTEQEGHAHAERVERLFREHNETLIRFLQARLGSFQEAREVAQEAYVRLLSLDQPDAVGYMRAFLFKTASNLAIDRRRRHVMNTRALELPLFHEFADARTPERHVAGAQEVARLQRLLAAMPLKCRQVFVLNRFDGMDVASISRELSLSERMVQKYIARALLYCRAGIDAERARAQESGK